MTTPHRFVRVFKTTWFTKASKKARIADSDLCKAVRETMLGQADDLGGGVYKKRLNGNEHRSIILAKAGRYWVYEYLFAKKDRDNISGEELADFRLLAKSYAQLNDSQLKQLLLENFFMEICNDKQREV